MTKEELKSKFPRTYDEIAQEGVIQERKEAQTRIKNENKLKNGFDFELKN